MLIAVQLHNKQQSAKYRLLGFDRMRRDAKGIELGIGAGIHAPDYTRSAYPFGVAHVNLMQVQSGITSSRWTPPPGCTTNACMPCATGTDVKKPGEPGVSLSASGNHPGCRRQINQPCSPSTATTTSTTTSVCNATDTG